MTEPVKVYVIACGDYVKIGISNDPSRRLSSISTSLPEQPCLAGVREFPTRKDARRAEHLLHWRLRALRARGEWYRVPVREALAAMRRMRKVTPEEIGAMLTAPRQLV